MVVYTLWLAYRSGGPGVQQRSWSILAGPDAHPLLYFPCTSKYSMWATLDRTTWVGWDSQTHTEPIFLCPGGREKGKELAGTGDVHANSSSLP